MGIALHEMPQATGEAAGSRRFTRRDFLAGAAAISTGLILDAGMIARHDLDISQHTLAIRNLPQAFHGFRILQISDIHLESFTEHYFLDLAIYHINRIAPDLVVHTGDLTTSLSAAPNFSRRAAAHCAELLQGIRCPQRYSILGNHDTNIGSPLVIDALNASAFPTLYNSHVPIERNGERIWLCGVDDPGTSNPILDLAIPRNPDGPVILLCHPPDFADEVMRHPRSPLIDVMLAGHSHGGQVCLPFVGPLILPPMGSKYVSGFFRFRQMQLYVSRGVGTTGLPFRLNCPPELTVFTLQPA
ncbi:MAG TPA: metallophosphoesterase [Granulicella sp.]